jgi:cation transport ATPase
MAHDRVKEKTGQSLEFLFCPTTKLTGKEKTVMLTGDADSTAKALMDELKI